jgi:alkylated DNA repair dioxygenase AlkB
VSPDDFDVAAPSQTIALSPGAELLYVPAFAPRALADRLCQGLVDETPWDTNVDGAFTRPRRTFWVGDFAYRYSGVTHQPSPWTETLAALRAAVERLVFGESRGQYRGLLLNLYRDGGDSVGFHSDDEPEIKPESPIASLSFGAERRFVLKVKKKRIARDKPEVAITLAHGSCLVMRGATQRDWRHGILAEPSVRAPRVNLTFREYVSRDNFECNVIAGGSNGGT